MPANPLTLPPPSTARPIQVGAAPVQVAVIIPAYNEEDTVGDTVRAFLRALPGCSVSVCDNGSTDATAQRARQAGAQVLAEPTRGKGHAVRRLLGAVHADVYVLADADLTYDADSAAAMISLLQSQRLDMVTGVRLATEASAYPAGHAWGNALFNRLFGWLFHVPTRDVFSGYRIFTRRFVRVLPVLSAGFEIETEMSAMAAILHLSTGEIDVPYRPRPAGSTSKLRTWSDGWRILRGFLRLFRHFSPQRFYGLVATLLFLISLALGIPVVLEYLETGLVPRFPTAILASSLAVIGAGLMTTGHILEAIARNRIEQRQLFFLLSD